MWSKRISTQSAQPFQMPQIDPVGFLSHPPIRQERPSPKTVPHVSPLRMLGSSFTKHLSKRDVRSIRAWPRSRPCVSTSRSAETPARSLFRADIPATHSFRAARTQEKHIRLSHIVSVSQEEYRDEHPLAVDHVTKSSGSYRQSPYFH